ncbi:2-dehydro-3-deoxygalactonokinase [Meridianimarinicoccus sp. RP-17]|uniref:2-dehydro-3-deoxygalactonokinase n=1 Tax=Meridianimarinicoccus zhengii TaxID=2056810 RepID=UPI000DAE3780|nr:2-dehydro-3-deoxygalactonokinase [Phycocomes zhengii]
MTGAASGADRNPVDWIAVDWGTSAVRAWVMAADGTVIAARHGDRGMGGLSRDGFEPALLDLVGDALPAHGTVPVICCGMLGSRQGWAEAPYAAVPCAPPGIERATRVATLDRRLDVHILPGIRQDRPADVMRGEETQIAGYLAGDPGFDGVLCLPGTHTKWAHISAGEVVSFRTFMTGEIFALLSQSSVLRHGLDLDGWDDAAFETAVGDAMSRPAGFAAELFSLRAAGLLHDLPGPAATARLSGLLIGLELAGARPHWLGQDVRVIGSGRIAQAYRSALAAQGAPVKLVEGDDMVLKGLAAARAAFAGGTP